MGTRGKTMADLEKHFLTQMKGFEEKLNKIREHETTGQQMSDAKSIESLKIQFENFKLEVTNSLEILKDEIGQKNFSKNILIYGVEENNEEELFNTVQNLFKDRLNIGVHKDQLNNLYRMGKKYDSTNVNINIPKQRPIVVEFVTQWMRDEVFSRKSKLKGSDVMLVEMLVKSKLKLFKLARDRFKNNCWTIKGSIKLKVNNKIITINNVDQINRLLKT